MILSGKNEENKSMKKAKRCLTAVVSGVLVASAVLSGCGQSKKEVSKNDDHLTVYLWENRLMKNIAPYIHEQFPDQDIEFIIGNNDTDLYSYFKEHDEFTNIVPKIRPVNIILYMFFIDNNLHFILLYGFKS